MTRLFLLINLYKVCLHLTVCVVYLLYYFQMFVRLEPTVFLSCFCPLYLPVTDSVPFCLTRSFLYIINSSLVPVVQILQTLPVTIVQRGKHSRLS